MVNMRKFKTNPDRKMVTQDYVFFGDSHRSRHFAASNRADGHANRALIRRGLCAGLKGAHRGPFSGLYDFQTFGNATAHIAASSAPMQGSVTASDPFRSSAASRNASFLVGASHAKSA